MKRVFLVVVAGLLVVMGSAFFFQGRFVDTGADSAIDYGPGVVTERRYQDNGEVTEKAVSYAHLSSLSLAEKMEYVTAVMEVRHEQGGDDSPQGVVNRIMAERFAGNFPFQTGQIYSSHAYDMMADSLPGEGSLLLFVGNRPEPISYSFIYEGKAGGRNGTGVEDIFQAYQNQDFSGLDNASSQLEVDHSREDDIGHLTVPESVADSLFAILASRQLDYQISEPDDAGRIEVLFYAEEKVVDEVLEAFASEQVPCDETARQLN